MSTGLYEVVGDVLEKRLQVALLLVVGTHSSGGLLAHEGHHRCLILLGVIQAVQKLESMKHLHQLVNRLLRCTDVETAHLEILNAVVAVTGATMGLIQLFDAKDHVSEVAARRGMSHQHD